MLKLYLLSVGGGGLRRRRGWGDTVRMIPVSSNHSPGNKRENPEDTKTLQDYPAIPRIIGYPCQSPWMQNLTNGREDLKRVKTKLLEKEKEADIP